MGEIQGDIYHLGTSNTMFQTEKKTVKSGSNMKKTNSQLLLALSAASQEQDDLTVDNVDDEESKGEESKEEGRLMAKVKG